MTTCVGPELLALIGTSAGPQAPGPSCRDDPHSTQVEGYRVPVVAAPMLGAWLTQAATEWAGEAGQLLSIEIANCRARHVGDVRRSVGKVTLLGRSAAEVLLDLATANQAGEITAPGTAVVRLDTC